MEDTKLLSCDEKDLSFAADLILHGNVVGIPTETVYGLGADATNSQAVKSIFEAKGRPSDNPLIVHISNMEMLYSVAYDIPEIAFKLAENFWPGPLTMVLKKTSIIPEITSGGLDTVGVRMPSHFVMRRIIELAGVPVAAPSANISGYPSPTTAKHVMADMQGRISAVIDGGECEVGVESTVVSFDDGDTVRILRPGIISENDLMKVCRNVIIDENVFVPVNSSEKVKSPGMKYKHYSPHANVVLVDGSIEKFTEFVNEHNSDKVYSMIFDNDKNFPFKHLTYGNNSTQQAHLVFSRLRELDEMGADTIYIRMPEKTGKGLAVYNRLIRAAGFEVIKL